MAMTQAEVLAYVVAAARAQGVPLDGGAAQRVASHLARTAQMATMLDDTPLAPDVEPAELYLPAPFPDMDGEAPR